MNELTKDQVIALYRKPYKLSEAQNIVGFEMYLQLSSRYQHILKWSFESKEVENFWDMMFREHGIRAAIAFHAKHATPEHGFSFNYSLADMTFMDKLIEIMPA